MPESVRVDERDDERVDERVKVPRTPDGRLGPRRRGRATNAATILGVLVVSLVAGCELARHAGGLGHDRMLPWILARAFGLAAYIALALLVAVGIWYRHPWRASGKGPSPEVVLRLHAALAVATLCLLFTHVLATVLDRYAGVGWTGAFVPWHATYRPTAVAIGTIALYGIILVSASAALAGSIAHRVWLPIHSSASVLFGLCVAHGLLAGSDTRGLWWLYVVSALVVVGLQATRSLASRALPADLR